ncbi:hypothetical protein LTR85_001549 [Meristemomyces frigidus]|nr:hypothetical protein LTR85_001549 [Meristemomyces frigidus]
MWLHAGTAARFEQSVCDIADETKIYGRRDLKANIFQLFRDWLSDAKKGTWVMHGSVLITSRGKSEAQQLVHIGNVVEMSPMGSMHAKVLLEKRLGAEEGEGHDKLAAARDYFPLAMAQAAVYIRERRPRCSVEQSVEELERSSRSRTSLLRREGQFPDRKYDEASSSILVTWQISFEHIVKTRRSAADLLSVMSFCDRPAIPESLARDGRSRSDGGESGRALEGSKTT